MISIEKQIELLVNEQVKKAIAEAVSPIVEEVRGQWGTVVSELVSVRKNREQLNSDVNVLIQKLNDLETLVNDEINSRKKHRQLEKEVLAKLSKYLDKNM